MLSTILKAFKVADIRKKLAITMFILALYRLGAHIPVPGINVEAVKAVQDSFSGSSILGFLNLFSGGGLARIALFALGIMPYITASIILQLLTVVVPSLEKLQKEGEVGQQRITQYTRYLTVGLSFGQSIGYVFLFRSFTASAGTPIIDNFTAARVFMIVLALTTGCVLVMWMGELITQRGIGNGMSLMIFASIVSGLPNGVQAWATSSDPVFKVMMPFLALALLHEHDGGDDGQRRIPVQYAKRVVGRRMYGGSSTHIPLKVNTGGVIPVIFASSIISFVWMGTNLFEVGTWPRNALDQVGYGMPLYFLLMIAGIIFFAYFYTAIIFNPDDVAENMRKYGGFIPGIRPGKRTAEHIDTILSRITVVGAVYLALIAILPDFLIQGFNVAPIPLVGERLDAILPDWFTQGLNVPFYFGGTSTLIVVGVAMDTVQQVESQLIMRHYDGFMKKTRIRGRRG